jgi:hypothetical protein
MKTKLRSPLTVLALLALFTLNSELSTARAQGTAFTYQGELNDSGSPANGNYDFTFALFNSSTNSGQAGNTMTNLDMGVTNGLFTVTLDFGEVFTGANYWLAIGVRTNGNANFASLSPLQAITPAPYAIFAPNAGSAASANSVSATNITGAIPLAQLAAAVVTNTETGLTLSGTFSGNGAGLTNLTLTNTSQNWGVDFYGTETDSNLIVTASEKIGTNLSVGGTLTMAGSNSYSYNFGNGNWDSGNPVPYVMPNGRSFNGIFDILGAYQKDNWMDIGTNFTLANPNGTFAMFRMFNSAETPYADVDCKGLGTAAGGALVLNNTSFPGVGANGGSCAIGFNAYPPPGTQWYGEYDFNGPATAAFNNNYAGTATLTSLECRNGSTSANGIRFVVPGTAWTPNGVFTPDVGIIETGGSLTNMSLIALTGPICFYTGGIATSDLRMSIGASGGVLINGIAEATNGFSSYNTNVLTSVSATSWSGQFPTINNGWTNTWGTNANVNVTAGSGNLIFWKAGGVGASAACASAIFTNAISTNGWNRIVQPNCGVQIVSGAVAPVVTVDF